MNKQPDIETLSELLLRSDVEDLCVLVDYITDSGKGRISLDKSVCSSLVKARALRRFTPRDLEKIETEIRRFGGNSIANIFRDVRGFLGLQAVSRVKGPIASLKHAVEYDEIVRDVAEHLKVKHEKTTSTPELEDGILKVLLISALEKTTRDEREAILKDLNVADAHELAKRGIEAIAAAIAAVTLTKVLGFQLSRTVASATLQALAGRALVVTTASAVARPVLSLAGPIGWALTGAWALADMASPAYRVTVPCVVQVAYMRRKCQLRLEYAPGSTGPL